MHKKCFLNELYQKLSLDFWISTIKVQIVFYDELC